MESHMIVCHLVAHLVFMLVMGHYPVWRQRAVNRVPQCYPWFELFVSSNTVTWYLGPRCRVLIHSMGSGLRDLAWLWSENKIDTSNYYLSYTSSSTKIRHTRGFKLALVLIKATVVTKQVKWLTNSIDKRLHQVFHNAPMEKQTLFWFSLANNPHRPQN